MDIKQLEATLEAILFYKGEPVKVSALTDLLKTPEEKVREALNALSETLKTRGIRLVQEGKYVALATSPETKELIEALRKEELEGPLGKAGLETLAAVMYQAPVTRADIEYVRGVNCSAILRSLTMRGLIERIENPRDRRSYLYQPTPELPAHFGVDSMKAIPEYEHMREQISAVLEAKEENETVE